VLAGIITGTTLQLAQWAFFSFIIGLTKYNAVYGSFASLPMFFIWFQISWLIILFGAELAFAHQNVDTYEFEQDCLRVSHSYKRLLSLLVMQLIVKNFCEEQQALNASDISHKLEIPIRLVRQILFELVESSVASEVTMEEEKVVSYQPGRNVDILSVKYVVDALEESGYSQIPVIKSPELKRLSGCIQEISAAIQESPANLLLKDI
jgi:membrane protein